MAHLLHFYEQKFNRVQSCFSKSCINLLVPYWLISTIQVKKMAFNLEYPLWRKVNPFSALIILIISSFQIENIDSLMPGILNELINFTLVFTLNEYTYSRHPSTKSMENKIILFLFFYLVIQVFVVIALLTIVSLGTKIINTDYFQNMSLEISSDYF